MERLTKRRKNGKILFAEIAPEADWVAWTNSYWNRVLEKLAAYEDSGLTPERAAELSEKDKTGWLIHAQASPVFGMVTIDSCAGCKYEVSEDGKRRKFGHMCAQCFRNKVHVDGYEERKEP